MLVAELSCVRWKLPGSDGGAGRRERQGSGGEIEGKRETRKERIL